MSIKHRYEILSKVFDERSIRLLVAAEAQALGRGGVTKASKETGVSRKSIALGVKELNGDVLLPGKGRIRREGGGRKKTVDQDPTLIEDLKALLCSTTRGDPESPLLWTTKSVRNLADELQTKGHTTSRRMVNELLWKMGYSLQSNRKSDEGGSHPDRDAQFRHISDCVNAGIAAGEPVISVDTKKKELIGNYKNNGREWHKSGSPSDVKVYDFIGAQGRVSPYGVYDIADNSGWVSVGVTSDTAEFAVESIRRWWRSMGKEKYPNAGRIVITADGGGSNGSRVRLWKTELQRLADELSFEISVLHFPPGTSKWNKIEHRMFSYVSMNWREKPLVSYEVIVNLIASTTTKAGLKIQCDIDKSVYEKGLKVSDEAMALLNIVRDEFHGEWNYTIRPNIDTFI